MGRGAWSGEPPCLDPSVPDGAPGCPAAMRIRTGEEEKIIKKNSNNNN